jgi:hypothetical protein
MAITQGQYTFNTGRDVQLKLVGPSGHVDLSNVLNWESSPEYSDIKINRMDGVNLNAALPQGWKGSFELYRANSGVDELFAEMEAAWLNDGRYEVSTVYAYITESDGGQTILKFDNCALKLDDAGSWSGDKEVKQKVSFMASRREMM